MWIGVMSRCTVLGPSDNVTHFTSEREAGESVSVGPRRVQHGMSMGLVEPILFLIKWNGRRLRLWWLIHDRLRSLSLRGRFVRTCAY